MNLLQIYNLFLAGACHTIQSLGPSGGQGDNETLRMVLHKSFWFITIAMLSTCVFVWIVPEAITKFFGASDESTIAEGKPSPAHLRPELHSFLLHLCTHDCPYKLSRTSPHGAVHLLRPLADVIPVMWQSPGGRRSCCGTAISSPISWRHSYLRLPPLLPPPLHAEDGCSRHDSPLRRNVAQRLQRWQEHPLQPPTIRTLHSGISLTVRQRPTCFTLSLPRLATTGFPMVRCATGPIPIATASAHHSMPRCWAWTQSISGRLNFFSPYYRQCSLQSFQSDSQRQLNECPWPQTMCDGPSSTI